MGVGYLLETLSGGAIPFVVGSGLASAIAMVFCLSGMRSVAWTDSLQALVMLVASFLLIAFVMVEFFPQGFVRTLEATPELPKVNWSMSLFIGLTLPWAFFAVTNPQVVQRLYTPKNPKSLRNMILGFSFFGLVYTLICGLLGFSMAMISPGLENADQAMPLLLSKVPVALGLVVTVSIMAAAVSTLNSVILTLGSMFGRDVARPIFKGLSERGRADGWTDHDPSHNPGLFCLCPVSFRPDSGVVIYGLRGPSDAASRCYRGFFLEEGHSLGGPVQFGPWRIGGGLSKHGKPEASGAVALCVGAGGLHPGLYPS